jgi:outer membrane protein, heavy metal efflux system
MNLEVAKIRQPSLGAIWLVLSMLSFPLSVQGQELQVPRLVQIAFQQHPQLSEATAAIQKEAGLRWQATRKPNPVFGYSATEIGNEGGSGQQGVYLSQQWVTAGKLEMAGQAAQWRTTAASERMRIRRLQISQLVQNQYWTLVAARQRADLLARIERSLGEAVEMNQALFDAAEINQGSLLQSMLEKNQVAVGVRQALIDAQAKSRALAVTLGVPTQWVDDVPNDPWPNGQFDMFLPLGFSELEKENASDRDSLPDSASDGSAAWLNSPELSEARALVEASRWELRLAQVQIVSNVDSFASLQHDAVTNDMVVGVQVGMALPIRDRKLGLVEAARATVNQSEAALEAICRDLQIRWAQALNDYSLAEEMQAAIDRDLLPLSRQRFELARQAYNQGEIDYLELLTAQRSYLTIQQDWLNARERATLADIRLKHLVVNQLGSPP